ncbi:MAG: M48 family metalloprotease [Candidatus Eremiobacterota bacterium]
MIVTSPGAMARPISPSAVPAAATPPGPADSLELSAKEQEALKEFRDRNRTWAGYNLTMPRTPVRDDIARARAYVQDMVRKLAGERLDREGLNLVVDLYSGEQLNAFMAGFSEEGYGKVFHRIVSQGQGGRPVYELGITVGSLTRLQSEEELAFLLGHELTHLFEHHTDPEVHKLDTYARAWLNSQAHEAVADHGAMQMMVGAGYSPEGGLTLLSRLHAGAPRLIDRELVEGLKAGAESHHHEGVRLSLAQAVLEKLRRTNPQARPGVPLHPLPDLVKLCDLPPDEGRLERLESLKTRLAQVTREHFLSAQPRPWMTDGTQPAEVTDLRSEGPPARGDEDAYFRAGWEVIRDSPAEPQVRVDALMRLLRFVCGLRYHQPLHLSDLTRGELVEFLAEQGRQGWRAERSLESLKADTGPSPGWGQAPILYPYQEFVTSVLKNPDVAEVLARLYPREGQWRWLVDQVPRLLCTNSHSGETTDLGWVADVAFGLARGEEATALDPLLKKSILLYLQGYDFSRAICQTDSTGDLCYSGVVRHLRKDSGRLADPEFDRAVRALLEPTVGPFEDFRDREAIERLTNLRSGDNPGVTGFLVSLGRTAARLPFRPASQVRLREALLEFARRANHELDFLYSDGTGRVADPVGHGLGQLFAEALHSNDLDDASRRELMDLLAANTPSGLPLAHQGQEAVPVQRVARYLEQLPTEDLLRMIESDHEPQQAGRLSHGIGRYVGLPPVGLSDADLADLARRSPEFFGLEAAKNRTPQQVAAHRVGMLAGREEVAGVLPQVQNRQLSVLNFLGADRDHNAVTVQALDYGDLKRILRAVERVDERGKLISEAMLRTLHTSGLSSDASAFLLDVLLSSQEQTPDLEDWYRTAHSILRLNRAGLEVKPDYRDRLEEYLWPRLRQLPPAELEGWLGRDHVLDLLHPDKAAQLLCQVAGSGLPGELAARVGRLRESLKLEGDFPLTWAAFREQLSEEAHLQPHHLEPIFPELKVTESEQAEGFGAHLRGLSALVGLARARPVPDQIATIEYLMGRQPDMPRYLVEEVGKLDTVAPVYQMVEHCRLELQKAGAVTRVLVANSFLAGPNSFVRTPEGLDELLGYLLREVRPEHQTLARRLATALLDSQGSTDSLALAYVLGQKGEGPGGRLSEAAVLNNLFDAYGVPGIKFKQYLAFTSEMAEFRATFQSAQDAALPLSYYEAIKLVHDRFGPDWPPDLAIEKILGSGSVNVGLKYHNPQTGQDEVAVVARGDIEESTQYDFFRFRRFLESLTNTPQDRDRFGYLLGLADVIHDSVTLEFDKSHAFAMQKQVQPLYNRQVEGWNVGTVDVFRQDHMTLFMEEARGIGARKLALSDPGTYRSAMAALSRVEMDALLGIDEQGRACPVPLHANPDFHDGQVIVDPATRSIKILDFGQAVPITNEQRDQAIDLLRVVARAQSPRASLELLRSYAPDLKMEELAPLLERSDRMDIFVHLLSLLNRRGARVPIAAVHWVLAINRQLALGENIGVPNDRMVRNLLLTERLGGSLKTYNRLHLARGWLRDHLL